MNLLSTLLRFPLLKTLAQSSFAQFNEVLFCCRNNERQSPMALQMRQDRRKLGCRTAVTA
jgi:hypothetical protein